MAEDSDDEEPAVELGSGETVAGVPLARVSSRLTYGIEKSTVLRREGETELRTADGPQRLETVLGSVDATYFERRQDFEAAVEAVLPDGPVPTE